MANWQRNLNLQPEWDQYDEDQITIQQLAKVIAERLKALAPFKNEDYLNERRGELADFFVSLANDPTTTVSDFDDLMSELYDWADTALDDRHNGKKVCWIIT